MEEWLGARAAADAVDEIDDVHPAAGADDAVEAGHFGGQLRAPQLREAAGGDELLALLLGACQFAQAVDAFVAGGADEAARIDDEHVRLPRFFDAAVAGFVH